MANVINKTTLQILDSVDTPNYSSAEWIVNPDLSALTGIPKIYWKIVGDTVVEMSQDEKDAAPNKYTYSVISDFPGGPSAGAVNEQRLRKELAASSLAGKFTYVNRAEDVLDVWFGSALTAGEKTTLDGNVTGPAGGLISAHNNATPSDLDEYEEKKAEASTTNATWTTRISHTTAVLDGTYDMQFYAEIKGSSTAEALRARLRDATNDNTLGETAKHPVSTNDYLVFSGALEYVFSGVPIQFKLQYYQEGAGSTANVRNARLMIRRKQ